MSPAMLAALVAFNAYVAEMRPVIAPDARVFVGAQASDGLEAVAWTKCVPESHVFVIQVSTRLLDEDIRHVARHELCHIRKHADLLCEAARTPGAQFSPGTRMTMELIAEACAKEGE